MKLTPKCFLILPALCFTILNLRGQSHPPIRLHPEDPHYFLFRGEPAVVITSGEHYGCLLNLGFDYDTYFRTLSKDGLNNTRVFSGAYVETEGNFNIAQNTLNPASEMFICPWARSEVPGYAYGGNKFDLSRWDPAYFKRLHDLVQSAGRNGIIVEMNLFCPMYNESMWSVSPMNTANNVNGWGGISMDDVYRMERNGELQAVQEAMVRKIVQELKGYDNVYYEICNEPYARDVPLEWEHRIVDVILDAQKDFAHPFLVSRNIANNTRLVENPHPGVSIFNFHYATPPRAVEQNYHWNKVIGDNETGFRGTADAPYRMEAWDFIVAGGGLFNHLDYSFTAEHPDGTFQFPSTQPGGGGIGLRRQFGRLKEFIEGFDFIRMKPDNSIIKGGIPKGYSCRALVREGEAYALYMRPHLVTQFSVRWTGYVQPRWTEEYTFHTFSNDGVRFWIDGRQIIDNWTDHSETEDTGKIELEAGKKYPVKLEYFYNGGQSAMKLWWSSVRQEKEPVPSQRLFMPDESGNGLLGEYFEGNNFQTPWKTRADEQVDFAWGTDSPFSTARDGNETSLALELPKGEYQAVWLYPETGERRGPAWFNHAGGRMNLKVPKFDPDIALSIVAVNKP